MRHAFSNGLQRIKVCFFLSSFVEIRLKQKQTNLVCPTCRKRCWIKDILYIDVSNCIVAYGKKKIENLSVERDRLNNEIQLLKNSIFDVDKLLRKTEHHLKLKRRFLHRLRHISKRKHHHRLN